MSNCEKDDVLERDDNNVNYDKLLDEAKREGRLGEYRCVICGIGYENPKDAKDCCTQLLDA